MANTQLTERIKPTDYSREGIQEVARNLRKDKRCRSNKALLEQISNKDIKVTPASLRDALVHYLEKGKVPREVENNQIQKKKNLKAGCANNGGPRKGSGRKKGAATKKTREIADKCAADGKLTPLEFMLEVMRTTDDDIVKKYQDGDIDSVQYSVLLTNHMDRRYAAAKDAAPYIHPRLASIQANVSTDDQAEWVKILQAGGYKGE